MCWTVIYNMAVKLQAALSRVERGRSGSDLAIGEDYGLTAQGAAVSVARK